MGAIKKRDTVATSKFKKASAKAGLSVHEGKQAMDPCYHGGVTLQKKFSFTCSVDLDDHFQKQEPHSPRWDYGVGVRCPDGGEIALWIEPHPAGSTSDAKEMLKKLKWLKEVLNREQFKELRHLHKNALKHTNLPYRWLISANSKIRIFPHSKEAKAIAVEGLDLPRRRIVLP